MQNDESFCTEKILQVLSYKGTSKYMYLTITLSFLKHYHFHLPNIISFCDDQPHISYRGGFPFHLYMHDTDFNILEAQLFFRKSRNIRNLQH